VYRLETKRRLSRLRSQSESLESAQEQVSDWVDKAETCFAKSREHDPESEYGYIAHIQLLVETVEGLFRISGHSSTSDFWRQPSHVVQWCADLLAHAEDFLDRVKSLQAHRTKISAHTLECQSLVEEAYGRYGDTISTLNALLRRDDIRHHWVRRHIANAYLSSKRHSWSALSDEELSLIRGHMERNLDEDPTNIHDLRRWFSASRRLRDFDALDAIARLENWARREEAVEPHFYLYSLHFIRWLEELSDNHQIVRDHEKECEKLAGSYGRTFPREWLALEPPWCPLLESSELGPVVGYQLSTRQEKELRHVKGRIVQIRSFQAGYIRTGPFRVFFVPGSRFIKGRDEETWVTMCIGFSYEGLRAYNLERFKMTT